MKTIREIGTVRKLQLEKVGRAAPRSPHAEGRAHDSSDHERLLQVVEAVADLVAIVDSTGRLTYVNPSGRALIGIGDAESLSHLRLPDLHPPKQRKDLEYVALPAAVREGTWIGETTLLTQSGREIPVSEMLIVRKSSRGRVENVTVVMRDVRNRKRSEERLHHSEARFRTLVETMNEGLVVMDRQGVVAFVNERFATMMDCTPSDLIGRAFCDFLDPAQREPMAGYFDEDAEKDDAAFESALTCASGQVVPIRMSMRRVAAAERGRTEICAVVSTAAGKTDVSRAWQAAVHDRQRLSCQILAVQEAERKRVAVDLHDGLGQALSAIKFSIEQAQAGLRAQQIEEASKILGGLVSKVKDAVNDVRHIAMNLRPSTLDDLGILATLSWFLREFQSTYGSVVVDKAFGVTEHEVPESVKLTLFRVVQEAMNNVAKHSHATRVAICLSRSGDDLTMTISDNGIGFDPIDLVSRDVRGTGLGRAGLRDRVEISGGTFQIDAARGKGVCLRMSWPLANESHFGNAECLNRCGGQDE